MKINFPPTPLFGAKSNTGSIYSQSDKTQADAVPRADRFELVVAVKDIDGNVSAPSAQDEVKNRKRQVLIGDEKRLIWRDGQLQQTGKQDTGILFQEPSLTKEEATILMNPLSHDNLIRGKATGNHYHPIYCSTTPEIDTKRHPAQKPVGYIQYALVSAQDGTQSLVKTIIPNPNVPIPKKDWSDYQGRSWIGKLHTPNKGHISFFSFQPQEGLSQDVLEAIQDLRYIVIPHHVDSHTKIMEMMEGDASQINRARQRAGQQPLPLHAYKGLLEELKTLHIRGLIHRDLKPENILSKEGEGKLGDLDSLAFRQRLSFALPTISASDGKMIFLAKKYESSWNSDSIKEEMRAYQAQYGKVCDDYAMLLALIDLTGHTKLAFMIRMDQALFGAKKAAMETPDIFDRTLHRMVGVIVQPWLKHHVKKPFQGALRELLSDPGSYYHKYGDTQHLYDMLVL